MKESGGIATITDSTSLCIAEKSCCMQTDSLDVMFDFDAVECCSSWCSEYQEQRPPRGNSCFYRTFEGSVAH